jgi:hypothetical protein
MTSMGMLGLVPHSSTMPASDRRGVDTEASLVDVRLEAGADTPSVLVLLTCGWSWGGEVRGAKCSSSGE